MAVKVHPESMEAEAEAEEEEEVEEEEEFIIPIKLISKSTTNLKSKQTKSPLTCQKNKSENNMNHLNTSSFFNLYNSKSKQKIVETNTLMSSTLLFNDSNRKHNSNATTSGSVFNLLFASQPRSLLVNANIKTKDLYSILGSLFGLLCLMINVYEYITLVMFETIPLTGSI